MAPSSETPQGQGKSKENFTFGSYLNNAKTMIKQATVKDGGEMASDLDGDALTSAIKTKILNPIIRRTAAASILSTFAKS